MSQNNASMGYTRVIELYSYQQECMGITQGVAAESALRELIESPENLEVLRDIVPSVLHELIAEVGEFVAGLAIRAKAASVQPTGGMTEREEYECVQEDAIHLVRKAEHILRIKAGEVPDDAIVPAILVRGERVQQRRVVQRPSLASRRARSLKMYAHYRVAAEHRGTTQGRAILKAAASMVSVQTRSEVIASLSDTNLNAVEGYLGQVLAGLRKSGSSISRFGETVEANGSGVEVKGARRMMVGDYFYPKALSTFSAAAQVSRIEIHLAKVIPLLFRELTGERMRRRIFASVINAPMSDMPARARRRMGV